MTRHARPGLTALLCTLLTCTAAVAQDGPADADAAPAPQADPVAAAIEAVNVEDNGVTINREAMTVDIQAKVCLREADFLEMLACTPDTREHESILVLSAKPSTIHFALLLLGLEPGKPLSYDRSSDPPKLVPPTGPAVEVFIVREIDGHERATPANRWVQDTKTNEMMADTTWLFTGSQFFEYEGTERYRADVNGSAVSLVNFGDDLLTLNNAFTDQNDSHNKVWVPRTRVIPEVGTAVVLRLKAQPPQPADNPGAGPADPPASAPAE